jgi:hypothetical protein
MNQGYYANENSMTGSPSEPYAAMNQMNEIQVTPGDTEKY